MIKKLLLGLLALVLLLGAALGINTARKGSRQLAVEPIAKLAVDDAAVAQRLAEAVRLRTESSRDDAGANTDQFQQFHALLQARFPLVHAKLKREVVGDLSLLYTWPGSNAQAAPVMLMAHQDVVPVTPGTEGDWKHPPFGGVIADGAVWGRGSIDDKGSLVTLFEGAEALPRAALRPVAH